ncbi:putative toxin-antitoxin system toxin component, PIN family [uncultured Treponema sp.]|uniref:putative toxin-antitoxin system toxin component, PIN family n=1 Tax=uncultured Treponema sp. TaxID=162155 RepID=UPI0025940C28|nr:putative toxin-antitoxin system toxin component, PIN family [uncultured Treponema sp.]
MKAYAILDTNVIVSALISDPRKKTPSLETLSVVLYQKNKITLVYSDEILEEYKEVLSRPVFGLSKKRIGKFINDLKKKAIKMERIQNNEKFLFPDKDDIVFYEITLSAKSKTSSFLITGNLKHYPREEFVVTPSEFIQILNGKKLEQLRTDSEKPITAVKKDDHPSISD